MSARGIFDQIRFGQAVDGGVVLDVSNVPDDVFRHENRKVVERLDPHGIDYRQIPLIIAPEAHFVMGGVLIDEWGASSRPGLYACGESAGGVHGGNRLNSNAVPETQVFGHRAGLAAARHATSVRAGVGAGRVDERTVLRWARRLAAVRDPSADISPMILRCTFRRTTGTASTARNISGTTAARTGFLSWIRAVALRVERRSVRPIGTRSVGYESSRPSSAPPWATIASFQPRL